MGQKSIHELGLHEESTVYGGSEREVLATRVPGGWVYENWFIDTGLTSTFVPYSDEFKDPATCPAQQWLDKSDEQLRLEFDDLTPDELLLVRAVLGAVAREAA